MNRLQGINWKYYEQIQLLEIWQVALLSCNIDPKTCRLSYNKILGAPSNLEQEVLNRLDIITAQLKLGKLKPHISHTNLNAFQPKLNPYILFAAEAAGIGGPLTRNVLLCDFAIWADSLKWKIPIEFLILAGVQKTNQIQKIASIEDLKEQIISQHQTNAAHASHKSDYEAKEKAISIYISEGQHWKSVSDASRIIGQQVNRTPRVVAKWLYKYNKERKEKIAISAQEISL